MPTASTFPAIDVSGVTELPLRELLRHDPNTPEYNQVLRKPDREVSITKLKRSKWPAVTTVEPETAPEIDVPDPAPEVTPEPETAPVPEPQPAPDSAPGITQE